MIIDDSLSGPLGGQYGDPAGLLIPAKYANVSSKEAYIPFYTRPVQDTLSVANYWRDSAHYNEYVLGNLFLPAVDNITRGCVCSIFFIFFFTRFFSFCFFFPHQKKKKKNLGRSCFFSSAEFPTPRDNFLRLKRLVLYGSPDDGVISPWQSAFFGVFGPDNTCVKSQSILNHFLGIYINIYNKARLDQVRIIPPGSSSELAKRKQYDTVLL
jgi:hypothetical protein